MEASNIQEYDGILLCMSQLTGESCHESCYDRRLILNYFPAIRIPVFEILSQFTSKSSDKQADDLSKNKDTANAR